MRTNVFPLEPRKVEGKIELAAEIEMPNGQRDRLWYRIPEELGEQLTASADPFLVAVIFAAMKAKADVHMHGTVSPFLIRNLMEYQAYWYAHMPRKYKRVEIQADAEKETDPNPDLDRSICAFSGGIDSCYTVYRHASGICGKLKRNIGAGLFVHGFDIPLDDEPAFIRAFRANEDTLKSLGIPLFSMQTNHRLLFEEWNETHAAGVASSLMFFKRGFSEGMIPGTYSYVDKSPTWGSNPTSDHLMSTRNFSIFHDGAVWNRGSKLIPLKDWQTGYERLRVCYSNDDKDKNCGRCGKCLVTLLLFNVMRLPVPCSFSEPLSKELIANAKEIDEIHLEALETFCKTSPFMPFRNELTQLIAANKKRLAVHKLSSHGLRKTGEKLKEIFGRHY
jgi:hypothetical protein